MSLYVALNTSVSGLLANQTAIGATSENIANVNTPDFARREARFSTDAIPDQFAGVDVNIIRSASDRFLKSAAYGGAADATRSTAISEALSRIEASLGAPGDNISFANKLDDAFAALTQLSAAPSSTAGKGNALLALQAAFDAFDRTTGAVQTQSDNALSRLTQDVTRANALLGEIYRLNQQVASSPGAADLIDQNLSELSTLLSIDVTRDDRGRVSVALNDGTVIADSAGFAALGVNGGPPTAITLSSASLAGGAASPIAADISGVIGSGEIAGLVQLRNVELPRLATLVQTTARGVADQLNAVYAGNVAIGATSPTGTSLIVENNGVFSVNSALLADPSSFAIARPAGGAAGGANDGSGAIALANVAMTAEARAAAESIANIGTASRNASLASETDNALSQDLSARAAASGGVNLDEELSNLILYQRAYGANARVISAINELWQTLLQTI